MSPNWLRRAFLAAALGLGVWAGLARAADPTIPAGMTELPPGVSPEPPGWFQRHFGLARAAGPKIPPGMTELPPGVSPEPPGWFQRHFGLGCWASFNGYGCSSLHSELAYIFGSCRTFYSEPCLKGPPPSPLPPWAGQNQPGQPGGGQQAAGDCHCP